LAYENIRGIRAARLGKRHSSEPVIQAQDPAGRNIYWIGPAGAAKDASDGTDFDATSKDYVAVTPLQIDLTNMKQIQALAADLA
jgi:5'-nucleotidase